MHRSANRIVSLLLLSVLVLVTLMPSLGANDGSGNDLDGADTKIATPIASTVLVDGENLAFEAYNIEGNNYFKLRDLAFSLRGTPKEFEVSWDADNDAIKLSSHAVYTVAGSEMQSPGMVEKAASPSSSRVIIDDEEVLLVAYNIEGSNYFKLRDIAQAFGMLVGWDDAANTIKLDTSSTDGGDLQPEPTLSVSEEAPTSEQIAMPDETGEIVVGDVIVYELFPMVPAYENVDEKAVLGGGAMDDNVAFHFYETNSAKLTEYRALLVAAGFSREGTIRDTLLTYNMEYYRLGNIHVAIGMPKRTVYVRIAEKEMSSEPTANELRALAKLFNYR